MERAGQAMQQIQYNLNIDKVDETMYVEFLGTLILIDTFLRDKLREQHALGEEIANAITSAPIGEQIDETELENELAELEQEQMDEQLLKTGTVPVSDQIHRLPTVAQNKGEHFIDIDHDACQADAL